MKYTWTLFLFACASGGPINTFEKESEILEETEDKEEEDIETEVDQPVPEPTSEPTSEPSSDDSSSESSSEEAPEETPEESSVSGLSFTKTEVFTLPGSAWLHPVDLDNDGFDEYLLTCISAGVGLANGIGAGSAAIISRDNGEPNGSLGAWSLDILFDRSSEIYWPNDSSLFDVNNDGVSDWVIGTGFLPLPANVNGSLTFMPGYVENGEQKFDIPDFIEVPWEGQGHFYHKAYPFDMNGDGAMDFVTTNYKNPETDWFGNVLTPGVAKLEWFENNNIPGQASFTHHEISDHGGTLLLIHDVDEDGDPDLIMPQYFAGSSLIWMENEGNDVWTEHMIDNTTGRGFDVELADMNGDGVLDLVYGNHNHQFAGDPQDQTMGVYWFEIPPADQLSSLSNWNGYMNVVAEGFYVDEPNADQNGAPGVFHTGDVNGDGLMDVSVSGDGDDGLYVYLQESNGSFTEVLIDTGTVMAGDHQMADLDGDGDMDYIWAIYGSMDIFSGEIEPQSYVNVYLQD